MLVLLRQARRQKLPHVRACGGATGFSRCFALEHVVESVRVPCANARRGCPAKTAYHGKEEHEKACPHAEGEADAGPAIPQRPAEQGGNRGSRARNLVVVVLVLASIPVAIPAVRGIVEHFGLPDPCSCVAT
ncbi:hypothetical protein ZEAMMB73_Zm00001d040044 [Zea mays]|uniref:Uncharacterized protein n=1 Tax=Zea mays TaxID=4577 RepID=A0A1D6MME5_MAIZE|nr:hypothetical protein ZEAMMB73_Zm00001d040044 [Zea mays]